MKDLRRLTGKQRLFVFHYLDTMNQTKAAERAGYKGGYSTWARVGSENVRKCNIWDAIKEGMEKLAMPRDEILARLTLMGRGEIRTRKDDTQHGAMEHFDEIKAVQTLGKYRRLDKVDDEGTVKCLILDMPVPEGAMEGPETEEPERKSVSGSSPTLRQLLSK